MKIFEKTKLWIIIALVAVLVGTILLATVGFNQTPDYKAAYEVSVSVDDNARENEDATSAGEIVKAETEKYFAEKGYKSSAYAAQASDDGRTYIYKFNSAGEIDKAELKTAIETAIQADAYLNGLGLEVTVSYSETKVTADFNAGMIVLACAVALVAAFLIALFITKVAGAVTMVCNAVFAFLIYLSVVAITRIPAFPTVYIFGAAAAILASAITFAITCAFDGAMKEEEKADVKAVASTYTGKNFKYICFVAAAGIALALFLSVTGSVYLLFTGLHCLVATCSAAAVACVSTPALWAALKSVRRKK